MPPSLAPVVHPRPALPEMPTSPRNAHGEDVPGVSAWLQPQSFFALCCGGCKGRLPPERFSVMQLRASEELRRCKRCASRGGASSRGRDDEGAGGATERVTGPITLSEILLLEKAVGILGDDEYLLGDLSTVCR